MFLIFLDMGDDGIVEVTGSIPVGSTNIFTEVREHFKR
jgi:hypothetical protein